jgi:hypothetical protein
VVHKSILFQSNQRKTGGLLSCLATCLLTILATLIVVDILGAVRIVAAKHLVLLFLLHASYAIIILILNYYYSDALLCAAAMIKIEETLRSHQLLITIILPPRDIFTSSCRPD